MSYARPLFLDATHSRPMVVHLDGPALRVTQDGRSDGRYPMRMLSRIHSVGNVEWSSDALHGLMEKGITITFERRSRGRIGVLLPRQVIDDDCNQHLEELLDSLNGWVRLEEWCSSANRREILRLQQRIPVEMKDLRITPVRQQLEQRAERHLHPEPLHQIRKRLLDMGSGLVAQQLMSAGVEVRNLRKIHVNAPNLDHIQLFTELIGWDIEVLLYQLAKGICRRYGRHPQLQLPHLQRLILRAFNHRSNRLNSIIDQQIVHYRNWLSRELNQ